MSSHVQEPAGVAVGESEGWRPPVDVLPELRLRLPGRWFPVPLHDQAAARSAVRELVAAQIGPADDRALLRIDAERRLLAGLDAAIRGDGQSYYVALTIVPGVPIPITALVAMPTQQLTPAVGTSGEATMAVLAQGLANVTEGGAENLHRFAVGQSQVARRTRQEPLPVPSPPDGGTPEPRHLTGTDTAEPSSLVVEYWMTVPGTKRFVLVQFTTPLTAIGDVLTGLFDSIVSASYWA